MSKITPSNRTADLGNDPVGRLLVRLALPTITAQIVNLLYNIVDRIYIGRIPLVSAPAAFQAFHFAVSSSAIGISAGRISP